MELGLTKAQPKPLFSLHFSKPRSYLIFKLFNVVVVSLWMCTISNSTVCVYTIYVKVNSHLLLISELTRQASVPQKMPSLEPEPQTNTE